MSEKLSNRKISSKTSRSSQFRSYKIRRLSAWAIPWTVSLRMRSIKTSLRDHTCHSPQSVNKSTRRNALRSIRALAWTQVGHHQSTALAIKAHPSKRLSDRSPTTTSVSQKSATFRFRRRTVGRGMMPATATTPWQRQHSPGRLPPLCSEVTSLTR